MTTAEPMSTANVTTNLPAKRTRDTFGSAPAKDVTTPHDQQYVHDHEGRESDVDAVSPAGHFFAIIYHVRNAHDQQTEGQTSSKSPTEDDNIFGGGDPFITAGHDRNIVVLGHDRHQHEDEIDQCGDTPKQRRDTPKQLGGLCASVLLACMSHS